MAFTTTNQLYMDLNEAFYTKDVVTVDGRTGSIQKTANLLQQTCTFTITFPEAIDINTTDGEVQTSALEFIVEPTP